MRNFEKKRPELLAPAGGMEALYAAVAGGADAVYLGGKLFSARANAKNFSEEELARAVVYCHLHGVKVYVTLNILLFEKELPQALAFGRFCRDVGVDGIIAADAGLICALKKELPDLPIHISTQFTVHSLQGAKEAAALGAERVVLARELSLEDIQRITAECGIETEMFLHGALCVCHSGGCLFSSLVGGRSGNRGACAQPCRLPYNGKYPLSLKDLCLASHIPALIQSGVSSLKIEGRMKAPAYVYGITRIYRRLLDEGRPATEKELSALAELFSRGGFTDGYLRGDLQSPMTGVRSEEGKETSRRLNEQEFAPTKKEIFAHFSLKAGEECKLSFTFEGKTVQVSGEIPQVAEKAALTKESLYRSASKLGDTFFTLPEESFTAEVEEGLFLPMGALHSQRRRAAALLEEAFRHPSAKPSLPLATPLPKEEAEDALFERTALFYREEAYEASRKKDWFTLAFLPLLSPWEKHLGQSPIGVALPAILMEKDASALRPRLEEAAKAGIRYCLVENPGQIALAVEAGLTPVGDFRLNITNPLSMAHWRERGVCRFVLSPELSLPQIRDLAPGAPIVYGHIPLMVTERCFVKENGGCRRCGSFYFTDRIGARFPVLREYPHRNLICNSIPTYMGDKQAELARYRITRGHFLFTVEDGDEIDRIVSAFQNQEKLENVRRISKESAGLL